VASCSAFFRSGPQGLSLTAGNNKKPTQLNTQKVLNHVGLLGNGPPGTAGLPFI
jgi:hypothetical protein